LDIHALARLQFVNDECPCNARRRKSAVIKFRDTTVEEVQEHVAEH